MDRGTWRATEINNKEGVRTVKNQKSLEENERSVFS